jgi:hypothetical protein
MELFEDFEFKPLTEGLGFHRNAAGISPETKTPAQMQQAAQTLPSPRPQEKSSSNSETTIHSFAAPIELPKDFKEQKTAFTPSLKPEYNFMDDESLGETKKFAQELSQPQATQDRTKIYQPIGRKDYSSTPNSIQMPQAPVVNSRQGSTPKMTSTQIFSVPQPGAPASLSALRQQKTEKTGPLQKTIGVHNASAAQKAIAPSFAMNALTATATTAAPTRTLSKAKLLQSTQNHISTCVPAAVLDAIFAFGMSTILLVIVLLITKADLIALLSNSATDHFVQFQLALLYVVVLQMYVLLSRSTLFGQTLGEWTYEIQLGDEVQRAKAIYPVRVVFRGLIFALTGFIVLPILSLIFSKDVVAKITGLELVKKPYAHV